MSKYASESTCLLILATVIGLCWTTGCSQEANVGTGGSLELYESSDAFQVPKEVTTEEPETPEEPEPKPEDADPLSDPAYMNFVRAWVGVHRDNDTLAAYQLMDWSKVFDRALSGVDALPSHKEQFIQQMRSRLQSSEGVQRVIAQGIRNGDDYRFVRLREKDGIVGAVFRHLRSGESGADFQIVELSRDGAGGVRGTDIFSFLTGLRYTDELRWRFQDTLAVTGQLAPGMDATSGAASVRMLQLIQEGNAVDAVKFYRGLPDTIQKSRRCMFALLDACRKINLELFVAALERYVARFGQDGSVALLAMELAVRKRDANGLLTAIDQLETEVGVDPFLQVSRAFALTELGRLDEAEALLNEAQAAEPRLFDGYRVRLNLLARGRRFTEMIETIQTAEKNGVPRERIVEVLNESAFVGFRGSPEYRNWIGGSSEASAE